MSTARTPLLTPVLLAGCIVIIVSFAIRASFGVFQIPIATEFNWPRSEFSLAIALQNLFWGIGQPIFWCFGRTDWRSKSHHPWCLDLCGGACAVVIRGHT